MKEPKKPGPKARDTSLYKGAAIQSLSDTGVPPGQIAEDLGVSLTTVEAVLAGQGKWASLNTDVALQQYRQKNTRQLELITRELSFKALQRIEDTLSSGGLSAAVIAFGVLQDKARLLAGESTQNIAFGGTVRMESEKLTDMLAKLVSSLSEPVEEAQIIETKEPPCTTTQESKSDGGLGLLDGTG